MPFTRLNLTLTPKAARIALHDWLHRGSYVTNLTYIDQCPCPPLRLREHPFGLAIPQYGPEIEKDVIFLGNLMSAEMGMEHLQSYLGWQAPQGAGIISHLRIIFAQLPTSDPSVHVVYYEVGVRNKTYIALGGNDRPESHAGEVKECHDALFALLSYAYEKEVEQIEASYQDGQRAWIMIRNMLEQRAERNPR